MQQCKRFTYTVNNDTGRLPCADSMTEILWFDSEQEQEIFVAYPKCHTDFGAQPVSLSTGTMDSFPDVGTRSWPLTLPPPMPSWYPEGQLSPCRSVHLVQCETRVIILRTQTAVLAVHKSTITTATGSLESDHLQCTKTHKTFNPQVQ
jgi:hypothetical protein